MADTTNYTWTFDLRENSLTSETTNDYIAIVQTNKSLTIEDIAASIASDRTDLREDTIIMVAKLYDAKVRELVCQGNTVVTGIAVVRPTITGVFTGTSGEVGDSNTAKISIAPSSTFRSEVEDVTLKYSKRVLTTGGASITLVTDNRTGATDGTVTPGGMLVITGEKIKCLGEDGVSQGVVRFTNIETNESTVVEDLSTNTPTKLVIVAPSSLTAGSYQLTIETYFTSGAKMLTQVRQITYEQTLTVSASE